MYVDGDTTRSSAAVRYNLLQGKGLRQLRLQDIVWHGVCLVFQPDSVVFGAGIRMDGVVYVASEIIGG